MMPSILWIFVCLVALFALIPILVGVGVLAIILFCWTTRLCVSFTPTEQYRKSRRA